jgi:nucleotide-binding universal stress UspA family protein
MAKRVLVPVDGSGAAAEALDFVREEWPDATLVLATVIDPADAAATRSALPTGAETWYAEQREMAMDRLTTLAATWESDTETVVVPGRPIRTIVSLAADVDHVVMSSHGRTGLSRAVLGSVAEGVIRRSPVPVTVVRAQSEK